jgi:hypothetical protein
MACSPASSEPRSSISAPAGRERQPDVTDGEPRASRPAASAKVCTNLTGVANGQVPAQIREMTIHAPKLLTPEEFASLIEVALTAPAPELPPAHLSKLVALGYVVETTKGPLVTGDGLIRITESE